MGEKLRPLLRDAHLGSAKCCENTLASKQQLENCMHASFQPAQQVQEKISNELNNFQNRLSRCAKQCQDEAQDNVTSMTSREKVAELQGELDKCIVKCCDSHIELVPKMMLRVNEVLEQF